jgi:hypothetical protein
MMTSITALFKLIYADLVSQATSEHDASHSDHLRFSVAVLRGPSAPRRISRDGCFDPSRSRVVSGAMV